MSESSPIVVVDDEPEWIEITRQEAQKRLEQMMTQDLVAFEVDSTVDDTPVGAIETYTWLRVTDDDDQLPVLLALKDPVKEDATFRWFLHYDLVQD